MKKIIYLFICFALTLTTSAQKQYNSYKGLVMAGYQGWHGAPYDGAGRGWGAYGNGHEFKPGACTEDFWPDVSEYDVLYRTGFKFADGSPAYVPSPHDSSTVATHFRWMKDYGVDGAFMQRFVSNVRNANERRHFDKVLASAMAAANVYERAICVMYDLSGLQKGTNDSEMLLRDIDEIAEKHSLWNHDKNPSYLYHNGKPLVVVWGLGFTDRDDFYCEEGEPFIDGLIAKGYSVMLGIPTNWRTLKEDARPDKRLHDIIKKCDIILPWSVGRYDNSNIDDYKSIIKEDMEWTKKNGIDYVPLACPGFSWENMTHYNDAVPRNKGNFYWKQLSNEIALGAEMIYIAMFDEIDEGTAIYKCAKRVPISSTEVFVPIEEGLETDHYLWLTGMAAKMLRKEIPLQMTQPKRK